MDTKNEIVTFLRKRDYIFLKELGQGACGKTVLLLDDVVDQHVVCKKFQPDESHREALFGNFLREIKLLHELHHHNVVRVFSHFVYPEQYAGYILMEYIDGSNIEDYVDKNPEQINEIFIQTLEGFEYLERVNILHRDIRPQNIMVREDGVVKIIDLGFGKRIENVGDFGKSISLNWWCEPPAEFAQSIYDFRSEVYFVGKLFEKIINGNNIQHFKYNAALARMCAWKPEDRLATFLDAKSAIDRGQVSEVNFSGEELTDYRAFAAKLNFHLVSMAYEATYVDDVDRICSRLDAVHKNCMLEMEVPDASLVLSCFIIGAYRYRKKKFPTSALQGFVSFLKRCNAERKQIVLANIQTRLDAAPRQAESNFSDEDIPF